MTENNTLEQSACLLSSEDLYFTGKKRRMRNVGSGVSPC